MIAQGLHRPNGIALHNGTLYIAELSQISKIDNIEDRLGPIGYAVFAFALGASR